jgi:hypothetical protein
MAFVCKPGSDPGNIQLNFQGQDSMVVDAWNFLQLYHNGRHFTLPWATAYQVDGSTLLTLNWSANFEPGNGEGNVHFQYESFDTTKTLVLLIGHMPLMGGGASDGLSWSTLIGTQSGGIGESKFNTACAADEMGNLYVTGNVRDAAFPSTPGMMAHAGNYDAIIGKFLYAPGDPEDARMAWMTFYGGSGQDKPTVAHVSNTGEALFIGGWTASNDLVIRPLSDPSDGTYYQNIKKDLTDGFITKLNLSNGNIHNSTYFGGEGDDMITAITEDREGNIYWAGATTSDSGIE